MRQILAADTHAQLHTPALNPTNIYLKVLYTLEGHFKCMCAQMLDRMDQLFIHIYLYW